MMITFLMKTMCIAMVMCDEVGCRYLEKSFGC